MLTLLLTTSVETRVKCTLGRALCLQLLCVREGQPAAVSTVRLHLVSEGHSILTLLLTTSV